MRELHGLGSGWALALPDYIPPRTAFETSRNILEILDLADKDDLQAPTCPNLQTEQVEAWCRSLLKEMCRRKAVFSLKETTYGILSKLAQLQMKAFTSRMEYFASSSHEGRDSIKVLFALVSELHTP